MPTLASELDLPEISATSETFDQRFARKLALDPDQWLVRNMFGYAAAWRAIRAGLIYLPKRVLLRYRPRRLGVRVLEERA